MAAAMSLVLAWFWPALNNFVLLTIPLLTRLFARIARNHAQKSASSSGDDAAMPLTEDVPSRESAIASTPDAIA